MGTLGSPEEFVGMVGVFGGWVETERFVVEGEDVVHMFTYHMTSPAVADIPMCEALRVCGRHIAGSRAYYDPTQFPAMADEALG